MMQAVPLAPTSAKRLLGGIARAFWRQRKLLARHHESCLTHRFKQAALVVALTFEKHDSGIAFELRHALLARRMAVLTAAAPLLRSPKA